MMHSWKVLSVGAVLFLLLGTFFISLITRTAFTPGLPVCDLGYIKDLIDAGRIDDTDQYGRTALMIALSNYSNDTQCLAAIEMLLRHGASVSVSDSLGRYPIHLACELLVPDVVELLASYGAEVNTRNPLSGETPLLLACQLGRVAVVDALLRLGAEVTMTYPSGMSPVHLASATSTECLALILRGGVDVNRPDEYGLLPLHYALRADTDASTRLNRVRLLLAAKANPEKHTSPTTSPPDSHIGLRAGRDRAPNPMESPIEYASRLGYEEIRKLMEQHGQ